MPIYAYRCAACGHAKDVLQKLSDAPLAECPACGAPRFVKQVTAAGFQLKGSGWYATDFRNNGSAKPEAAAKKDDAAPAGDAKAAEPAPSTASPTPAPAPSPAAPPPASTA